MSRVLQALKIREIGEALDRRAPDKPPPCKTRPRRALLASPKIPEPVRGKLLEYVDEKIAGTQSSCAVSYHASRLRITPESHRVQAAIRNRLHTVHSADHVYVAIGPQQTTPLICVSSLAEILREYSKLNNATERLTLFERRLPTRGVETTTAAAAPPGAPFLEELTRLDAELGR